MAKDGFVVNVDGRQERCSEFHVDFNEHSIAFHSVGTKSEVKDWSTFSVHAITRAEAEDIVYSESKKEVKEP